MKRVVHFFALFMFAFALLVLSGCANYQIQIKPQGDLSSYRKVYVGTVSNDMHFMRSQISARLKQGGFTTVEVDPHVPIGSQGSGFVLDAKGHILTCAHVVLGHSAATVWIKGKRYLGTVLATDANVDAALIFLSSETNSFTPLPVVRNKEYELGEEVYAMGFPMAEELGYSVHLTKGLVSSTSGLHDDPKQIQISAQIQPGNSGGPVLNDKGEAIGMVRATYNPLRMLASSGNSPQDINFAIKNATLEGFLKKANFELPPAPDATVKRTLSSAEASIVLIRAGIVEDKDVNVPALWCAIHYVVPARDSTGLLQIKLRFIDMKTYKTVLTVEANDRSFITGHGEMLDAMFLQIFTQCFPTRPNPFRK